MYCPCVATVAQMPQCIHSADNVDYAACSEIIVAAKQWTHQAFVNNSSPASLAFCDQAPCWRSLIVQGTG
jgi:hypothetical protein